MSFHILVLKFKKLSSEDEFSKTHLLEDEFSKSYPLENEFHLMQFSKQERYEKCIWMLSMLTVFIEPDRPLSPREPRKLHSFFHSLSLVPLFQWSLYESELFSSKKKEENLELLYHVKNLESNYITVHFDCFAVWTITISQEYFFNWMKLYSFILIIYVLLLLLSVQQSLLFHCCIA